MSVRTVPQRSGPVDERGRPVARRGRLGVMEPESDVRTALREEVGRLRARERRRVFDPCVCLGTPGGEQVTFAAPAKEAADVDAGLRTDVVARLLAQAAPQAGTVLLLRAGEPHPHDLDLAWFAAAGMAFGAAGRPLVGFYAVTRTGWLNVVTGERKTWKRLRL